MSAFPNGSNSNVDNVHVETLMGRLQLRNPTNNPLVTQSLEDFLLNDLDDDEDYDGMPDLERAEAKVDRKVIKIILSGNGESILKPNSGQAVSIHGSSICVGFKDEEATGFRAWEWHGHVMAFDEEFGENLEYIYVWNLHPVD
ncbi:hypothetical protein E2542_SST12099 [Spatholobus suberectus]|nr:hypothetical protein E2542_SST12099 [Spatholobus suberectus]